MRGTGWAILRTKPGRQADGISGQAADFRARRRQRI